MACIIILFTGTGSQLLLHLFDRTHGDGIRDKAATLLRVIALGYLFNGSVTVVCHRSIRYMGLLFFAEGPEVFHDLFDLLDKVRDLSHFSSPLRNRFQWPPGRIYLVRAAGK